MIRFTSEPAYSTLTAPVPVAVDEAEADAAGDEADAVGELAADELDELDEELQPAAASPMKARPTTANRARVDRYLSMMRP